MKHIFKIIVFILIVNHLHSQQIVMFNHYFYKPMVYNPAFTGTSDAPNLMLINHTQWTGFKGGPQYNLLTFDGNLINKNTGLGISIVSDKKGVNNRVGGNISYSYKIKFKEKPKKLPIVSGAAIIFDKNLPIYTNRAVGRFKMGLSPGLILGYGFPIKTNQQIYGNSKNLTVGASLAPYSPHKF